MIFPVAAMASPSGAAILEDVARRCLIVDDNAEFLDAARKLLQQQGISVVGVASTSADALALAAHLRPEVVLVDVDLGRESGLDLARSLAKTCEPVEVILISAYAEKDLCDLVEESPAVGFVSKSVLSRQAIDDLLDRANANPGT
jgi:DNA-binding NarL/FixJ family response regulator